MGSERSFAGRAALSVVLALTLVWRVGAQNPVEASPEPSRTELAEVLVVWLREQSHTSSTAAGLGSAFRPSYFDQVQFRTESDRLDRARQRYSLRLRPKLPYLRNAEREVQLAQRAELGLRPREAEAGVRGEALQQVFAMDAWRRELNHLDTLLAAQATLIRVSRDRLVEDDYDVERLLDEEDDYSEIIARQAVLLALLAAELPPVPLDRLVTTGTIRARMASLRAEAPTVGPTERTNAALTLIDAEVALVKAENWKVINFVQLDYRTDLLPGKERYSVGGGVDLPQPNRRLRELDELQIERADAEQRLAIEADDAARTHAAAYGQLQALFVELDAMRTAALERQTRRAQLQSVLLTSATTRPDALLRIERRSLNDRADLLEIELEIAERYAEWVAEAVVLDVAGVEKWILE